MDSVFFQNQFLKSFLTSSYHCRAQYFVLRFKWLVNPQNLLKRLKKSTADGRNEKRCNDVSMQSGTLLMKKSWTKNERKVLTVHSPLFFRKNAEIARFSERAAILVSNVLSLAWVWVLNLLKGRRMVWEKAKKICPSPHHHCYKPWRPPPRYIWTQDSRPYR